MTGDFKELVSKGIVTFIDLRTESEFDAVHH